MQAEPDWPAAADVALISAEPLSSSLRETVPVDHELELPVVPTKAAADCRHTATTPSMSPTASEAATAARARRGAGTAGAGEAGTRSLLKRCPGRPGWTPRGSDPRPSLVGRLPPPPD